MRPRRARPVLARPTLGRDQQGAQALELAMAVPLVLAVATLVVAAGQIIIGLTATHHLAVVAARTAATAHDSAVIDVLSGAEVEDVVIEPPSGSRRPGDLVTVTLTRIVPVLWMPAPGMDLSASATFRTEDLP